jgi:sulfopyruvate decarboxylase TPP-binding subunit
MFDGPEIAGVLKDAGTSHVVLLPDSTLGPWEAALWEAGLSVVRVCREGEAWAVAGGLYLGGARPLVMIQCTGLFESGDALRNMLFDYGLPLPAVIGYRSRLNQETLPGDTALHYTEPILKGWGLDYRLICAPEQLDEVRDLLETCREERRPGIALIAEGRA